MRTMLVAGLCAGALVLFLAAGAAAKDTPSSPALDAAKALAKQGETMKAADAFGDVVARAQAAGDLQAEEAAAHAMEEFFGGLERPQPGATTPDAGKTAEAAPNQVTALAAAMRKLDPARCGAYVSAPVLARNVLLLASETGETSVVSDAAAVASAHASKAGSGRAAAVVARYAEGMKASVEKRFDAATAPLDSAMKDAGKAGWFDVASHAGTELAAAWFHAGDSMKALGALAAVASFCDEGTPHGALQRWQTSVAARLADLPESVRKPAEDTFALYLGEGSSASAEGGRGGKPQKAGEEPISDVGRLLKKLAKGKPFVSVTCTKKGMDVHWATAPDVELVKPFEDGEKHADQGGVTLSFSGRGVALRMLDLVGRAGQPGESSEAGVVRAYYLLDVGETWAVSKDGVVTITGGR